MIMSIVNFAVRSLEKVRDGYSWATVPLMDTTGFVKSVFKILKNNLSGILYKVKPFVELTIGSSVA